MKPLHAALGAGLAVALVATQPLLAAEPAKAKSAQTAARHSAAPAPASTAAQPGDVDPAAITALTRMSAYLGTLKSFEIKTDTSTQLVMEDGQKLNVDGKNHYLVRRPDGFVIEVVTDNKQRQFIYDGKSLVVNAPKLGYYAKVPAPPTIKETLDAAYEKYGISLPLEDLFRWSDPTLQRANLVQSAMVVGMATVDGVACDQYAFREGDVDWQIWIQRGDKPLPRKVVIVDRLDPSHPESTAKLDWNTSPNFASDAFAFNPAAGAKAIRMAAQ
ncbi:MAG: DUF2092 domain-containing protein [Phenylobacterium sp.]